MPRFDDLVPDPELALERKIAIKYTGSHVDVEPPGTARFAATVVVEGNHPPTRPLSR